MNRRDFLHAAGGLAAAGISPRAMRLAAPEVGAVLPPWQPGFLDIHHINTGRGNSALVLMPDGTSLLIDAGAAATQGPAMCAAKPNDTRRPGEWIARYVQRQLKAVSSTDDAGLDFALTTHLHGDHVGDVGATSPESKHGGYRLTGLSDVAEVVPIDRLIDRGFPEYQYPARAMDAAAKNYIAFVSSAAQRSIAVEKIRVGSAHQISMRREGGRYPGFEVRMIAGNGEVWTCEGSDSRSLLAVQKGAAAYHLAGENTYSIALRMKYGKFAYFTGGDLNCDTNYGRDPWQDVETAAGKAAGPVSVSTCNHHGYFDAMGPEFVSVLRPRVWILQSWHASHPAMSSLANMYSEQLYPGPRDVFCTGLHPAAALTCGRFSDQFKSSQGHVLVRVAPGGAEYSVLAIDDGDEQGRVKAVFGPYAAG